MNYRKLRKAYLRRFHVTVKIKYWDKSGRYLSRLSKVATARKMKEALYINHAYGGITAE